MVVSCNRGTALKTLTKLYDQSSSFWINAPEYFAVAQNYIKKRGHLKHRQHLADKGSPTSSSTELTLYPIDHNNEW